MLRSESERNTVGRTPERNESEVFESAGRQGWKREVAYCRGRSREQKSIARQGGVRPTP